jgi:phospholipase C
VRRRVALASLVGTLCLGAAISTASAAASAATASARQGKGKIEHVVVLYQENHAFNDVLGDLCVIDSRCTGSISAAHLQGHQTVVPHVAPDRVPTVDHSIQGMATAINGGKMNGWAQLFGCHAPAFSCVTYYRPDQIPALATLARKFVIADHTFQSTNAPSWGAHLNLATGGTLDGFTGADPAATAGLPDGPGWGCDSNKTAPWVSSTGALSNEPSCVPDYYVGLGPNGGAFEATPVSYVPTIMDRLDAGGVSWKLYAPTSATPGYGWAFCPNFAECLYTSQASNMVPTANVLADAASGSLPNFAVVSPTIQTSQHNDMSMATGDNWIGRVVSAIENGPDWASTAIFITYDDCGCFYDPVSPPVGDGIRAPLVIVSPYARAGFTDKTTATVVGSILAFVEHTFNLQPLTAVDGTAYDFGASFNYSQRPIHAVQLPRPLPETPVAISPEDARDPT